MSASVPPLTRLLARALRGDYPATELSVAVVGDGESPSEIVAIAGRRGKPRRPASSYVDLEPGLGFADWRCEVLSLLETA